MDIVLGMQQVCNLLLFFMEAFNLETVEEHSKGMPNLLSLVSDFVYRMLHVFE